MKASNLKSFALGFGIAISALGIYALAATLTTFKAGDVVSSSKINDNFAALNTSKQDRVAGTCAVGQTIRSINADGTVVCSGATLRAVIKADGTVLDAQSSGVTSSSRVRTGVYDVVFPRSIVECSRMAQWVGGEAPKIVLTTSATQNTGNAETARVFVTDTAGAPADDFFTLLVVCD
jgi:hypothetical protein